MLMVNKLICLSFFLFPEEPTCSLTKPEFESLNCDKHYQEDTDPQICRFYIFTFSHACINCDRSVQKYGLSMCLCVCVSVYLCFCLSVGMCVCPRQYAENTELILIKLSKYGHHYV